MNKIIITAVLLFSSLTASSQKMSSVYTDYSRTNRVGNPEGGFNKEKFVFKIVGNYVRITDLDFDTTESYGPLKIMQSGFSEDGVFNIKYMTDVGSDTYTGGHARLYVFNFDKKGGEVLYVDEIKMPTKSFTTYYTEAAYKLYSKP